jgi:hypothetical protein
MPLFYNIKEVKNQGYLYLNPSLFFPTIVIFRFLLPSFISTDYPLTSVLRVSYISYFVTHLLNFT